MPLRRKRIVIVAAILVVIVAIGTVGYFIRKHVAACTPNAANAAAAPRLAGAASGTPAWILGDSYSTGWKLAKPTLSWAYRLTAERDLRTHLDGFPGTGYIVTGACGPKSFPSRVKSLPTNTRVAIVEGGLNDAIFDSNPTAVERTAEALFRAVKKRAPHAELIVVGPASPPSATASRVQLINDSLKRASQASGGSFVDLTGLAFHTVDGTHPDAQGQQLIADAVAKFITR